jgi:hypothetical protein
MVAAGFVLLLSAMALGIVGLAKPGYELLASIAMVLLVFFGFAAMVKGIVG